MFIDAARHRYDILHIHPPDRAMPLAITHPDIPVVYTLHDPIYPWRRDIFRMFQSPNQYFVSISDAQRRPAPDLNYAATIYNGIPLDAFPFSERSEDFFLFVGRLHPEKGVREAVEAARLAGVRLKIIGPPVTGEYWEKHVKPYLGEQIEYVGFVPRKDLFRFYGRAKATLVPIQWEEPFGLVLVESMACGTPVIAFRRGSVPEVVKHGETGLIVETVEEIAAAIKTIDAIDRAACRRHVEEHFSIEKMAEGYERVFLQILEQKIEERT
jgi:glycosyltransferase involved in cell wall biosynthesis